jgi:hypothetical protein
MSRVALKLLVGIVGLATVGETYAAVVDGGIETTGKLM